jgi:hypothetical protein
MRAFYAVAALGATLALCGSSASLAGPGGEPEKTVPQGQDPPFGRLFDRGGKLRIDESERANAGHVPYLGASPQVANSPLHTYRKAPKLSRGQTQDM